MELGHLFTPGSIIAGRFKIESLLGKGGMASVYAAYDQQSGRRIALKCPIDAIGNNSDQCAKLRQEYELLTHLNHKNIVKGLEWVADGTTVPFFTMELISGRPLKTFIAETKPSVTEILSLLARIAEALAYIHSQGIIVCDLKPDNVLVTDGDTPKPIVIDFGIAQRLSGAASSPGFAAGTSLYMSPEQLRSEPLDARTDVYSFGALCFEALTGHPPFDHESRWDVTTSHLLAATPSVRSHNKKVPAPISKLVARCLEKDRKDRYPSMLEIVALLTSGKTTWLPRSSDIMYKVRAFKAKWLRPLIHASTGLLMMGMALWYMRTPDGAQLEVNLLSKYFDLRGTRPPPAEVVIVSIDDESFARLNASTNVRLPRKYIAEALERIAAAKPQVFILDAKITDEHTVDPDADTRIEAALRSMPSSIWNGVTPGKADGTQLEAVLPSEDRFRKAAAMELPMTGFFAADTAIYLADPAKKEGTLVELVPMARPLTELAHMNITAPSARALINFYGPPNTIPRVSIYRLTDSGDRAAAESLRGKIVLLGYQSLQFGAGVKAPDSFKVPNSSTDMFGVEIHAQTIGNLIDGSGLNRLPRTLENLALLQLCLFMGAFAAWQVSFVPLAVITACMLALLGSGYIAFAHYNLWIGNLGILFRVYILTVIFSAVQYFWRAHIHKKYLAENLNFEHKRQL